MNLAASIDISLLASLLWLFNDTAHRRQSTSRELWSPYGRTRKPQQLTVCRPVRNAGNVPYRNDFFNTPPVRFRRCYSAWPFADIPSLQRSAKRLATHAARIPLPASQRRAYRTSHTACTQSHPRNDEPDSAISRWHFSGLFGLGELQAVEATDNDRT